MFIHGRTPRRGAETSAVLGDSAPRRVEILDGDAKVRVPEGAVKAQREVELAHG